MDCLGGATQEGRRAFRSSIASVDWSFVMATLRVLLLAAVAAHALNAFAQNPPAPVAADHAAHHPPNAPVAASAPAGRMAMMDAHMKAMREMHEKMSRAGTPEERQALMAEHMKLMHEGMAKMGGMGMGAMKGAGPAGAVSAATDIAARQDMLEKRMDMMQSMMQMMMDRMGPPTVQP